VRVVSRQLRYFVTISVPAVVGQLI